MNTNFHFRFILAHLGQRGSSIFGTDGLSFSDFESFQNNIFDVDVLPTGRTFLAG